MTYHFDEELKLLLENRIDGSIGLLQKFFELIINHSMEADQCIDALDKFTQEFSDMQVITRFNSSFDNISHTRIIEDCEDNLEVIKNCMVKISRALLSRLNSGAKTFLVYSNSKTVQLTIQNIPDDMIEQLYVMRSDPGGEGLSLYNNLESNSNLGSKLILINDEDGFDLIKKQRIDYLLLGCDQYYDNWFVNKIGSGNLIKLANKHKISIIVLTQKWKKSISADYPLVNSDLLEIVDLSDKIYLITD